MEKEKKKKERKNIFIDQNFYYDSLEFLFFAREDFLIQGMMILMKM